MLGVRSCVSQGYSGLDVAVECVQSSGLPNIVIVGLAGKSVEESKERVRAAFKASSVEFPRKKITINVSPADIPKNDSALDLAIAVAIAVSSFKDPLPNSLKDLLKTTSFVGELGLDGRLKPTRGVIGKIMTAKSSGSTRVIIPGANVDQANLVDGIDTLAVKDFRQVYDLITGKFSVSRLESSFKEPNTPSNKYIIEHNGINLETISGHDNAKRALIVAVAGGHNIHMYGPPGSGKSLLAKAVCSLLPPLTPRQRIEVTHLHSLRGGDSSQVILNPPFRSPHHTSSQTAIIGGGPDAMPGDISLAHSGVLLLDELPEYPRHVIESLRQPLEEKTVDIHRAKAHSRYPADFTLVATSNPCPCGYRGSKDRECICSASDISRYSKRLSGPIMDRIDINIMVESIKNQDLVYGENSSKITTSEAARMIRSARKYQMERQGKLNNQLEAKDLKKMIIDNDARQLLDAASDKLQLSSRGYIRTLRLARTIADIGQRSNINKSDVAESLQYRKREL